MKMMELLTGKVSFEHESHKEVLFHLDFLKMGLLMKVHRHFVSNILILSC